MVRWLRRNCKRCCKIVVFTIVVLVIAAAFYIHHAIQKERCTDEISRDILKNLCSLYNQTKVEGSLCYKLCNTKDLQYESCTNYKAGKKVLFMKCKGCDGSSNRKIRVVFKMKETLENREMFSTNMAPEDDSDESVKHYIEIISKLVNNSYWYKFAKDMSKEKDILSLTWGWNINEYLAETTLPKRKAIAVAASSIWSLSEQSEYLFSRLLHDKVFVPKIYGSCGPAYFVEFTQTIRKYEYELFSSSFSYPWPERALLAVRLIDLIKQIDSGLHEPLHICDVKPDNFGRRDNWEVTLLDTDCALFETDLMSQFNHSVCKTHADCDFFDCKGYCDKTRGHCLQKRMNNNLQSLCEDVFQGISAKFATGLLRDPPLAMKAQLYEILQECAYPGQSTMQFDVRYKALPETGEKLRDILVHSIQHTEFEKFL